MMPEGEIVAAMPVPHAAASYPDSPLRAATDITTSLSVLIHLSLVITKIRYAIVRDYFRRHHIMQG